MIGEIRDEETAHTAVRAANSGHLVLATLHSPLAAGAVQSMLAYGVNPYFLSNSLVGVVAQQLVPNSHLLPGRCTTSAIPPTLSKKSNNT